MDTRQNFTIYKETFAFRAVIKNKEIKRNSTKKQMGLRVECIEVFLKKPFILKNFETGKTV